MPRWWSRCASLSLCVALAACRHGAEGHGGKASLTPEGRRVVDQQAIEQSGARTAWEALQRTVPFFTFRTNSRGRPTRVEHRGRSSIVLRDQPIILVDGVEVSDVTALGGMPAADLLDIEVLTGVDATTYYGTNATNGVIRIRTKVGGGS
jgi:outer membrane cobalamin receptor